MSNFPKPLKIIVGDIDSQVMPLLAPLAPVEGIRLDRAGDGQRVLELARQEPAPDLIVMGSGLEGPGPVDVCRAVKADPRLARVPVLILAYGNGAFDPALAVEAGCDDILTAPVAPAVVLARAKSLVRLKTLTDDSEDAESVLFTLARTIEAKDPYTLGHADRVAQFAVRLGDALGCQARDIETLRKGGLLHDIGKLAIPDNILTKPGRYTPEEFDVMKRHPVLGCDICQKLRSVQDALPLIRHHHERLDGTGYPDGLEASRIGPLVRILSVVDIYDALRSRRVYKDAFSIDRTFALMWEEVGKGWWDKDVLAPWERIVREKMTDPFPA